MWFSPIVDSLPFLTHSIARRVQPMSEHLTKLKEEVERLRRVIPHTALHLRHQLESRLRSLLEEIRELEAKGKSSLASSDSE
jgi:predicted  nucleic acid-binding Zn-ribbon protein